MGYTANICLERFQGIIIGTGSYGVGTNECKKESMTSFLLGSGEVKSTLQELLQFYNYF